MLYMPTLAYLLNTQIIQTCNNTSNIQTMLFNIKKTYIVKLTWEELPSGMMEGHGLDHALEVAILLVLQLPLHLVLHDLWYPVTIIDIIMLYIYTHKHIFQHAV